MAHIPFDDLGTWKRLPGWAKSGISTPDVETEVKERELERQLKERRFDLFLDRWYGKLPAKQFCVILLRYVLHMSYAEVAQLTGKKPGALRKAFSMALDTVTGKHRN